MTERDVNKELWMHEDEAYWEEVLREECGEIIELSRTEHRREWFIYWEEVCES